MTRTNSHAHVNLTKPHRGQTMLSWQETVAILERCDAKGVPISFAVTFCTADEGKGTGGEIIHYERAVWHVPGGRVRRSAEFHTAGSHADRSPTDRSPATRWTRKIRSITNEQVRQLHVHLILAINGQNVR